MDPTEHFGKAWFPTVLSEEVLAEGTWWYGDVAPHSVTLVCQLLNYAAREVGDFSHFIHLLDMDHPDSAVNEDGLRYLWRVTDGRVQTKSSSFSTYEQARQHIHDYAGRVEIRWLADGSA